MKILHLSDLHYIEKYKEYFNKMIGKIEADINKNLEYKIDLIVVSGDLVDGREVPNFEETYSDAFFSILQLAESLGVSEKRIVVVQGNHEVSKNKYNYNCEIKNQEKLYEDKLYIDKILNYQLDSLSNNDLVLDDNFKQIEDFYKVHKGIMPICPNITITPFQSTYKYEIENVKCGVVGLNSSWRSHGDNKEYGNMLIGQVQVNKGLNKIVDSDIKIAVTHFPLEYLSEIEKKDIETSIIKDFDILLLGHTHTSNNFQKKRNNGSCTVSCLVTQSPSTNFYNSLTDSKDYSVGYEIIDIINEDIIIHHRIFSDGQDQFAANLNIAENGKSIYQIDNENTSQVIRFRDILAQQKKELDESLISHDIETVAPSNIENIFEKPVLTIESNNNYNEDHEYFNYDNLFNSDDNFIIFGTRESGRSTLLHNIFATILNKSLLTNVYPLLIEINNNFDRDIWDYILSSYRIGGKENIISLFKSHEILLLIDNVDFKNNIFLESLHVLINKYNIRIICTSLSSASGEIPMEIYDNYIGKYKILKIRPMTIEKVESFSNKWLQPNNNENKELVDKIISFSKENYMPTYPIYISMLLWLFESKNFLSFNNALIIENFIERLLNKHDNDKAKRNSFDFKNKVSLLTDIAKEISKSNNYCLTENCFIQIIIKHLEERKLPFSAKHISEELLDSGIIYELKCKEAYNSERKILFRYESILDYFLANKYRKDNNELMHVLESDELFDRINSIDILTALDRSRIDILDAINKKLEVEMDNIIEETNLSLEKIDDFFKREFELSIFIDDDLENPKAKEFAKQNNKKRINDFLVSYKEKNSDEKISNGIGKLAKLERLWLLAARLIRNLDDITDTDKKIKVLDLAINASIYFVFLFNYTIFKNVFFDLEDSELKEEDHEKIKFIIFQFIFTPFTLESFFQMNVGTEKLSKLFKQYYEEFKNKKYKSSLMKEYLITFLLTDNSKMDKHLSKYISETKEFFIKDNIYIKLLRKYYDCPNEFDEKYLSLIRKLKTQNKNIKEKREIDKNLSKLKTKKRLDSIASEESK